MELSCASGHPNKPCYVLRYKGVTLILDAGLDFSTILNFLPLPPVQLGNEGKLQLQSYAFKDSCDVMVENELREGQFQNRAFVDSAPQFGVPDVLGLVDMAEVDAILISNYTCMLALPYLTEGTGFKGMVFMTEPTMHFGRLFMEETVEYIERSSKGEIAYKWKEVLSALPPPLCDVQNPFGWKKIYSREKMESCLSKINLVGYNEKKDIFGLLEVSPVSSGYCLGSANWIISSAHEKIGYVSGSSTLTTHPRPIDQSSLKNLDCLILTSLIQTPLHNPDPMIGEFCKTVVETTKLGGNVLVPCYPSGIIYDLFECLTMQMDLHGLSTIPMFFVSPVADSSLAYSNIMAEWLSASKQNRVYLPEEPFPHGHLSRNGRLKSFRNLHDENFSAEYRQPCVMFCGHPSLRFGDVIHFIHLWGSSPNNTIVFTEPSFNYSAALAPFQPLQMKTVHCPIDTGINFSQAKKLIKELKPGCLAVPKEYTLPPSIAPTRTDIVLEAEVPKYTFSRYQTIKLPVESKFESITIDPKLAAQIVPKEIQPGIGVAALFGNLVVQNNKFHLKELDESPVEIPHKRSKRGGKSSHSSENLSSKFRHPSNILHGNLDTRLFVVKLQECGIADARVERLNEDSSTIHLENEDTLIQVTRNQTHVVCNEANGKEAEQIRKKIKEALLQSLEKI